MGVTARLDLLAKLLWLRERNWAGYALALAGPWLGFWEHLALGHALASATFLTFFPGIMLASLIGGRAAGGLATLISAYLAMYYLIPPLDNAAVSWPGGWVEVISFLLVSATFVALIDYTVAASANLASTSRLLRDSNEKLAGLARENAARLPQCHVVFVATRDGKFTYEEVNPATLLLYNLARERVVGRTIDDLFENAVAAELNAHLHHCLRLEELARRVKEALF